MDWWQTLPFRMEPVFFSVGPMAVHWYSLMYVAAFATVYGLVRYRINTEHIDLSIETLHDFFFWTAVGVLAGGRLGYVLFYDLSYFLAHPQRIFLPFDFTDGIRFTGISGMSFHGGMLGVIAAFYLFCRSRDMDIWALSDLICPAIPMGYFFGRLGNFINGELYGRATDGPWGMVFPTDPSPTLRHPSQLYEAFFEGIVLFLILWTLRRIPGLRHLMFALFLLGYGVCRFFIEFVRQPDAHLNFVWQGLTMGQVLCAAMMVSGVILLIFQLKLRPPQP